MFFFSSSGPSYAFDELVKCLPAIALTKTLMDQHVGGKLIQDLPPKGQECRRDVFVDIFKPVNDVQVVHHPGLFPNVRGERIQVSRVRDGPDNWTVRSDLISSKI